MPKQKIDSVELYYEQWGAEDAPPIVLLHGWTGASLLFKDFGPALAENYRVVAPDLRGHGQSAKPKAEYTIQSFSDDTRALLQALGIQQEVVLFGQSMGGLIALDYAIRYAETLDKLIIANSSAKLLGSWRSWLEWQMIMLFYRISPEKVFAKQSEAFFHQPPGDPNLLNELVAMSLQTPKDVALNAIKHSSRADLTHDLGNIKTPTLVITSEFDMPSLAEGTRRVHQLLPNSQLVVVPNCGHVPFIEQMDFVVAKIKEFVG